MTDLETTAEIWKTISGMDSTVRASKGMMPEIAKRRIYSQAYSRDKMFIEMAKRRPAIFRDVPVFAKDKRGIESKDALIRTLSTKFPKGELSNVQVGPTRIQRRLPVTEIMRRWEGQRAIVGVTDLHIRGTRVEDVIDTQALSDFNILIRGTDNLSTQEMMTLVIASPGNVTDSHSDDPDGTNHCFFGKKIWLVWETFEGIEAGLEDVERQDVYDAAKFNMTKFMSLPSARWFVVSTGDTLSLPSNMTHKVFTLDYYIGVGSFHVGLPGSIDNLSRWIYHGPLWSLADRKGENVDLVDEIARICLRTARRARAGSPSMQERWGYSYLRDGYKHWVSNTSATIKKQVLRHLDFSEFVELASNA